MGEKKKNNKMQLKIGKNKSFRSFSLIKTKARKATWLPGLEAPTHLDGTLPGDFGFDPLSLGKDPKALIWYQQAELQHARWAMVAVFGILAQSILKPDVSFMNAGEYALKGSFSSFGTLIVIQIILMSWVEGRRWQDIKKPGSTSEPAGNFLGFESILAGSGDLGYPGGAFDPAGLSKVTPEQINDLKLKEIKNGRLAMLAYVGFTCATVSTGKGPIENLIFHVKDPLSHNVMSNGYAIPFLVK